MSGLYGNHKITYKNKRRTKWEWEKNKYRTCFIFQNPIDKEVFFQSTPNSYHGVKRFIEKQLRDGPIVLYGFDPNDPLLKWITETFAPLSGTSFICTRLSNKLWAQYWKSKGFQVVLAATIPELESAVTDLCESIQPKSDLPDIHAMQLIQN